MNRKVACKYCGLNVTRSLLNHHTSRCPLSRSNLNRILVWIRDFIERSSQFGRIRIYPSAVSYNIFARRNRILSYNSLRRIFPGLEWKAILENLVEIAIKGNYVTEDEFPPFLRSLFSSTQFLSHIDFNYKIQLIDTIEASLLGHDWRLR